MSGTGSDIAVAPNGTVWMLSNSCNSTGCDFYDSANKGASFTQVSALAVDIAVDANNITWVMNAAGSLYKGNGRDGLGAIWTQPKPGNSSR